VILIIVTITTCYKLNSFFYVNICGLYNTDSTLILVYVCMWLLKLYYLMLLLPLNIIVLKFEIIMTVKISYNVGLIEYSFIDIASRERHQHICASRDTTQWSALRH